MYVKNSTPKIQVRDKGKLNICRLQIFLNLSAVVTWTMKLFNSLNIVQLCDLHYAFFYVGTILCQLLFY